MNILVTGSNGQLGMELRELAAGSGDRYIFTDVTEIPGVRTEYLDITDATSVMRFASEKGIGAIVNCAAYTDVEKAEADREPAMLLNADAVKNLAEAMKAEGGLLIHISTDYVFGKEPYNVPCREDQTGTPTGVYGETKKAGEQNILSSGCDYVTIRTSWLYSEYGKNFVRTMLRLTSEKPEIKVVFDQTGTPTYAKDLAGAILTVIEDYRTTRDTGGRYIRSGIYHYSNEGVCSWYDFAKMIAEYSGHAGCRIVPCHSVEFPTKVRRPSYSVLDKTKIKATFGVEIPYWTDSLKRCLENMGEYAANRPDRHE